jgi:hypothetical protein
MSEMIQYGIPAGDFEAEAYMRTYAENIAANYAAYGMSLADSQALSLATGNFTTAWNRYINPNTTGPIALTQKSETRNAAEALVRLHSIQVKFNAGISTALKDAIGVRQPNPERSSIDEPTTMPVLAVIGALPGSQTLRFTDSTSPTRRAKPPGVSLMELWVAISADEAEDRSTARSIGLFTKNPIGIAFEESDNQKIATYWGRWANSKGQYGPWSAKVSMTIAA